MTRALLCGILVFAFALGMASIFLTHDKWSIDGYNYSVRMLMHDGMTFEQARARAQAFFITMPFAHDQPYHTLILQKTPQYWTLFAPRVLYPWLGSLLYPRFGFESLHIVNALAFVVTLLLLYVLLSQYAPAWMSMLLTLSFGCLPIVKEVSEYVLTDILATACVTLATLCMVRYLRSGTAEWIAAFTVACGLLAFARPITYVPLAGAVVPLIFAVLARNDAVRLRAGWLAAISFVWCIVVAAVAAVDHAPGFLSMLRLAEAFQGMGPSTPIIAFLAKEVPQQIGFLFYSLLAMVVPIFAFVMLILRWREPQAQLMLGICASIVIAMVTDPIVSDVPRTALLPVLPALFAGAAMALARAAGVEPHPEPAVVSAGASGYATANEPARDLATEP